MLTFIRCPLLTENKHLLRDPELSSVTRNCQIYIMPLDTPKMGIYQLKDFMNCIKVKRNNLLNSIYSSVSPDIRFKETPYVNLFTDPELSSSLYSNHTVPCQPVHPPCSPGSISTPTTQSCVETVQPPHGPVSTSTLTTQSCVKTVQPPHSHGSISIPTTQSWVNQNSNHRILFTTSICTK